MDGWIAKSRLFFAYHLNQLHKYHSGWDALPCAENVTAVVKWSIFSVYGRDIWDLPAYYHWSVVDTIWVEHHVFTSSILSMHLWGSLSGKFHKTLNTAVPVSSTSICHFITKGFQYTTFWALWRLISENIMDFIPSSCILSYCHCRAMYNTFLSASETKLTPSGITCWKVSLVSVCQHSFLSETCNCEWGKNVHFAGTPIEMQVPNWR